MIKGVASVLKRISVPGILAHEDRLETVTLLLVSEVMLLNLAASLIGLTLGALAVFLVGKTGIDLTAFTSYNRYFAVSDVIFPRLTPYSLGLPPLLAFFFSLTAAIWPAVLVARRRAAEVLRIL